MTASTGSTPKFLLEELNAINAEGLAIHSVVDVEASVSGEVLRSETVVQPGGGGGPLHRHRRQEERFEILEGEIIGRIGRTRRRVRAGETFIVPPDAPHSFSVETHEPARFITEFRPGLRLAEFFAQLFWLADHGQIDTSGRIHPLQAAVLARAFPREFFYLPRIPAPLQQAIARPLAALARRRGYTADPAGLAEPAARVAAHGNGHAAPVYDRRMSHPDPSAPADRRAIEPGELWENPATRERAVIVEVPWQNSEGRAVAERTALPAARVMGEHLHPGLHERFSVLEGELTMVRDGRRSVLLAGDSAHIEPGVWHDWWNEAEGNAVVRVEFTPGERFVHMIETTFGLAREGHVNAKGMPSPLQLALTARAFSDVSGFRKPPARVQRVVFGALTPIATRRGYRATYPSLSRTTLAPRAPHVTSG